MTTMVDSARGLYLFCFTRPPGQAKQGGGLGLPGADLEWIASAHCCAVVERVPMASWVGPAAERNLEDVQWVAPRAVRHDHIIRHVMEQGPVFPVPFGALFSTPEGLIRYMTTHGHAIGRFLAASADKEEWFLEGVLDRPAMERSLLARHPRAAYLSASSGASYLLAKKLRRDVQGDLRQLVSEMRRLIAGQAGELAFDHRVLDTVARSSGRDVAVRMAFLVARAQRTSFEERIAELAALLVKDGLVLRLDGPLPPYRFRPALDDADAIKPTQKEIA